MIDLSQAGLNLKGVLIRGHVELVEGEYIMPEAISDANVSSYLSKGEDVTVKVHMDHMISWNLADSKAGKALQVGGWSRPLYA